MSARSVDEDANPLISPRELIPSASCRYKPEGLLTSRLFRFTGVLEPFCQRTALKIVKLLSSDPPTTSPPSLIPAVKLSRSVGSGYRGCAPEAWVHENPYRPEPPITWPRLLIPPAVLPAGR